MEIKKHKKIHLLPNVITAFGLSCGLFVIFKVCLVTHSEVNSAFLLSVTGILLLAAFADLLDGAVARAMKAESDFGGLFDSLADAISFGVAPVVIVLKTLMPSSGGHLSFFLITSAMIFSVSGVLRLVRFNINAIAAKGNNQLSVAEKKHFTGLPIPGAAAAIVSLNLFLASEEWISLSGMSSETHRWIMAITLIFIGYCMISRWKFPSIKSLEIKVASFRTLFVTVFCAVVVVYGILHFFSVIFLIFSWSYIFIAITLAIIRLFAGQKSKTLEEFEPEDEDDLEEF
jgi:CDP-diacylglycerol---serine O-phosphatidyltransferase